MPMKKGENLQRLDSKDKKSTEKNGRLIITYPKLIDMTCLSCGAPLRIDRKTKDVCCDYCGRTYILYDEIPEDQDEIILEYDDKQKDQGHIEEQKQYTIDNNENNILEIPVKATAASNMIKTKAIIAFISIIFVALSFILLFHSSGTNQSSNHTIIETSENENPPETTYNTAYIDEKTNSIKECIISGCSEEAIFATATDMSLKLCVSHYYCYAMNGYASEDYTEEFLETYSTENDKEFFSKIMPFVGMHEKYVASTILGDNYKFDIVKFNGSKSNINRYIWYRDDGRKIINLCFDVKTHCIESIALYYDNKIYTFYKVGEHPTYDNYIRSKEAVYPGKKTRKDSEQKINKPYDPYDVYDYDDPDDFAEDMWEEFDDLYEDGYDEAYDYWENKHK